MSRIGKQPVQIPSGVTVKVDDANITVVGPKGTLSQPMLPEIAVIVKDNQVILERKQQTLRHGQMFGLLRTLVANMVEGVTNGFTKVLEMKGVGYRAQVKGKALEISAGFSHPIKIDPPQGIEFKVEENTKILIHGSKKDQVGQIAASIRSIRKPEPYKGKGIYYVINGQPEKIIRKEGKRAAGAK
ncbi:MAG: 50S ribosomal protein L6 [bacterium]